GEVHEAVTQRRGSLRRTLRGVVLLRRLGVTVGLKAPILALSVGEIDAVLAVGQRLRCRVSLYPAVNPRRHGNNGTPLQRSTAEGLAEPRRRPHLQESRGGLHEPISGDEAPCAIGRRTTRIAPNGDVFPCPMYPVPAGNLRQHSFADIWSGAPLLERL